MSHVICPCGYWISDVGVPSGEKGHLLSDSDLMESEKLNEDQIFEILSNVWECFECGRIGFESSDRMGKVKWYSPDDRIYGKVMKGE